MQTGHLQGKPHRTLRRSRCLRLFALLVLFRGGGRACGSLLDAAAISDSDTEEDIVDELTVEEAPEDPAAAACLLFLLLRSRLEEISGGMYSFLQTLWVVLQQ